MVDRCNTSVGTAASTIVTECWEGGVYPGVFQKMSIYTARALSETVTSKGLWRAVRGKNGSIQGLPIRTVATRGKIRILQSKILRVIYSCMYSFGYFPGVWLFYADVSEHSICSIFIGWMWSMKYFILYFILYIQPLKMELIECSETSTHNNQTPGKYPKEYIQDSKQGESLKSRK